MMDTTRFIQLWQRNISSGSLWTAEQAAEYLTESYAESFRYYHDYSHIDECLKWFDRYKHTTPDPDSVELAIWFHDICYGVGPENYERLSADLFKKISTGGVDEAYQDKICQLIMDTKHQDPPQSKDGELLVDIDLASFARPWHDYLKDTARCRAERKPTQCALDFSRKQIVFLKSLLSRPSVYYSEIFIQNHQQDAEQNIEKLIELLQQRLVIADAP